MAWPDVRTEACAFTSETRATPTGPIAGAADATVTVPGVPARAAEAAATAPFAAAASARGSAAGVGAGAATVAPDAPPEAYGAPPLGAAPGRRQSPVPPPRARARTQQPRTCNWVWVVNLALSLEYGVPPPVNVRRCTRMRCMRLLLHHAQPCIHIETCQSIDPEDQDLNHVIYVE